MHYGITPIYLGQTKIECSEMMFYQLPGFSFNRPGYHSDEFFTNVFQYVFTAFWRLCEINNYLCRNNFKYIPMTIRTVRELSKNYLTP